MIVELTKYFEPVEDKPGYYWFNKRNYQIISEEKLKELLNKEVNMRVIDKFDGEYAFLSNFSLCIIKFDGNDYPSVEHAFQAAKTRNKQEQFKIWQAATPGIAKRLGRKVTLREDWEEVKRDYMREFIHQKFQDETLRKMLLATGDAELIEGNYWNDTYWGVCNRVGQNWLGKILMEERERIKSENSN